MGAHEDYQALKARLADREWRLDNLYWVQDEKGEAVRFVRNAAQMALWKALWYLNLILKGRQLGFSTFIVLLMLDAAMFNSNTGCGIIDFTLDDAEKKLQKAKFAYHRLPEALQAAVPLVKQNNTQLIFGNGSAIQVGTSHRGGTLQIEHVSEYGRISARFPDKAREIKVGAFGTIHPGQMIFVESTAEGNAGDFYDMVQLAEAQQRQNAPMSLLSFKLHFFAWWMHPGYRLDPSTVVVPQEIRDYVAELRDKFAITLDDWQIAWYAAKRAQIGPDDMFRDYPSHRDEPFNVAIQGAYFKREMAKLRADGRMLAKLYDPNKPVNTWWDIGHNDATAIWFHQTDGVRHRLIDYYENSGEVIGHYVKEVKRRGTDNGYVYGKHLGPHDLGNTDWSGEGKTRYEMALKLVLEFEIIPRIEDKNDAIDAAREMLAMCWIDPEKCERGIQCLDNYRKQWNERLATWRNEPLHDWSSDGADAFQTGAVGFVAERPEESEGAKRRRGVSRPPSPWAS